VGVGYPALFCLRGYQVTPLSYPGRAGPGWMGSRVGRRVRTVRSTWKVPPYPQVSLLMWTRESNVSCHRCAIVLVRLLWLHLRACVRACLPPAASCTAARMFAGTGRPTCWFHPCMSQQCKQRSLSEGHAAGEDHKQIGTCTVWRHFSFQGF